MKTAPKETGALAGFHIKLLLAQRATICTSLTAAGATTTSVINETLITRIPLMFSTVRTLLRN